MTRGRNVSCERREKIHPSHGHKTAIPVLGFHRVGRRRGAKPSVSCVPSSNRTCRFPASGSPITFVRRHAPQPFQVAHFPDHAIQPASFMKEAISPSFLSSPPGALVLSPKP